jgi:hypothetical protein
MGNSADKPTRRLFELERDAKNSQSRSQHRLVAGHPSRQYKYPYALYAMTTPELTTGDVYHRFVADILAGNERLVGIQRASDKRSLIVKEPGLWRIGFYTSWAQSVLLDGNSTTGVVLYHFAANASLMAPSGSSTVHIFEENERQQTMGLVPNKLDFFAQWLLRGQPTAEIQPGVTYSLRAIRHATTSPFNLEQFWSEATKTSSATMLIERLDMDMVQQEFLEPETEPEPDP